MSISHELISTVGAGFKRRLPFILKALGVCLICSAVYAGYLFYYRYGVIWRASVPASR